LRTLRNPACLKKSTALAVHAGLAAGRDFVGRVQLVDAPGKAAWRNRSGWGDIADLMFLRLAHVDWDELIGAGSRKQVRPAPLTARV
jgi:hypothetical protein